jgi:pyruvate,water dikinase
MRHMLAVDLVHGRIYFNMNGFMAVPLFGAMAPRILAMTDSRAVDIVHDLVSAGVLKPRHLPGSRVGLLVRILAAGLLSMLRLLSGLRPRRALRMMERDGASISRRQDVSEFSNSELIEEIRLFTHPECRRIRYGLQLETLAMGVYEIASRAFKNHPRALALLATGIPANPTTQISISIDQLSEAAGSLSDVFLEELSTEDLFRKLEATPEGLDWLSRFQDFLNRFGHRGPMEFDMGAERWSEDPRMILDLIRENLRSPSKENLRERMARLACERVEAMNEALGAAPHWRRPILRVMARLVELYMPLREAPKHYGVIVFQRMRQAGLELGKRFARDGIINSPNDVFFLEWPELQALARGKRPGADLSARVRERREQYSSFKTERAPGFLRSDGVPVIEGAPSEMSQDGTLRGAPASAGQAAGPVRILREPDPRAMCEGDVIVMEFADPGWTPLFPRAAAVVMEVGGLMCHAAVVAREMGIPAVFGVSDATRILTDGQRVTVDGTAGIVKPG